MALNADFTVTKALVALGRDVAYFTFPVHEEEQPAIHSASFIAQYGSAKSRIAEVLNRRYGTRFPLPIDLHNWLYHRPEDEVAYFLNEAGSNATSHSDYKAPARFHLWLGETSFIIGVEQKGGGFAAEKLTRKTEQNGGGEGSRFFRACEGTIFFDNPKAVRIVYFSHTFL